MLFWFGYNCFAFLYIARFLTSCIERFIMSKKELKRLESKIDDLSKQLGAIQKLVFELHKSSIEVAGYRAQWIEERREEAEKTEKKHEILLYYRSLAMGLLLGIMGNIFVSYLMKTFEIFKISSEGWILATSVALIGTFVLIWLFNRGIKKLSKEISSS